MTPHSPFSSTAVEIQKASFFFFHLALNATQLSHTQCQGKSLDAAAVALLPCHKDIGWDGLHNDQC